MNKLRKQSILGVGITNAKKEEILEYVFEHIRYFRQKLSIVTPNPEILVYATKRPEYKDILNNAQIAIPDGIGIMMAGRLLGKPFKERITGIDLMDLLGNYSSGKAVGIGFLGGKDGIAEKAAECLQKKYPELNIVFTGSEWPETPDDLNRGYKIYDSGFKIQLHKFINRESSIKNPVIDILFVAFGYPKQEEWISRNLERLPVKIAMGVGGAFDYLAGDVPRAPKIIRRLGLEWLFRLVSQPWRWRRQLALLEFIVLVIREKFSGVK